MTGFGTHLPKKGNHESLLLCLGTITVPQNREGVYSVKMDKGHCMGIICTSDLKGCGGVCTCDINVTWNQGTSCILGQTCILGLEVLAVSPRPTCTLGSMCILGRRCIQ